MLLINAKRNQTIRIGGDYRLTVHAIDEDNFTATLVHGHRDKPPLRCHKRNTVKVGVAFDVTRDVVATVTRINAGREPSVALGFDAPRRIKIRGEWMGQRTHKTDYVKLKAMPPAELIATAQKEATTDLELVLLENLTMQITANP